MTFDDGFSLYLPARLPPAVGHVFPTFPCNIFIINIFIIKSPGSDGLPYEVYIALADILILPMVDAFNEAFQAGGARNLAPSQRTGIVTLLHKGEGAVGYVSPSYPM